MMEIKVLCEWLNDARHWDSFKLLITVHVKCSFLLLLDCVASSSMRALFVYLNNEENRNLIDIRAMC